MGKELVWGFGINDADYVVQPKVNGKHVICDFYRVWVQMLRRCYDKGHSNAYPTYIGCTVCEEWLAFSKFKDWMKNQDWKGKTLDKDIICKGNKVYSPETCAFVDAKTNTFVIDCGASRGAYMIGVSMNAKSGKLQAHCRNQFTKKSEFLGFFDSEIKAHEAWKERKRELACMLAEYQTDKRVAKALRERYL